MTSERGSDRKHKMVSQQAENAEKNETSPNHTEMQHTSEQRQLANRYIKDLNYDVRAQMASIISSAEVLREHELPEQSQHLVNAIASASRSLLYLVNSLVEHSQISDQPLVIRPEPVDLEIFVQEMSTLLKGRLSSHRGIMKTRLHKSVPDLIITDPGRLHQMLLQLASLVVYSKEHETNTNCFTLSIDRIEYQKEDYLRYSIMRAHSPINETIDTSLSMDDLRARFPGLEMCTTVAQAMGGMLIAIDHERPQRGLSLILPLNHIIQEHAHCFGSGPNSKPRINRELRALVVDDDRINNIVTCAMLKKYLNVVTAVHSGTEALKYNPTDFDIIFLDQHMPKLSGPDTARIWRQRERENDDDKRIPIIAITADSLNQADQLCREAGMDDVFIKPVKLQTIEQCLIDVSKQRNKITRMHKRIELT